MGSLPNPYTGLGMGTGGLTMKRKGHQLRKGHGGEGLENHPENPDNGLRVANTDPSQGQQIQQFLVFPELLSALFQGRVFRTNHGDGMRYGGLGVCLR